jgi:hypothetical protein
MASTSVYYEPIMPYFGRKSYQLFVNFRKKFGQLLVEKTLNCRLETRKAAFSCNQNRDVV